MCCQTSQQSPCTGASHDDKRINQLSVIRVSALPSFEIFVPVHLQALPVTELHVVDCLACLSGQRLLKLELEEFMPYSLTCICW